MSMFRKFAAGVAVVVLVNALVQGASRGGAGALLVLVVGWCLFGYLCWRAAPGVVRDLGRLRAVLPRRGVHVRGGRDSGAML